MQLVSWRKNDKKAQDTKQLNTTICIQCRQPAPVLAIYKSGVYPNKCAACGKIVDPYVELEGILLAIDTILWRKRAIRHAICNEGPEKNTRAIWILCGVVILQAINCLKVTIEDEQKVCTTDVCIENSIFVMLLDLVLSVELSLLVGRAAAAIGQAPKLFIIVLMIWDYPWQAVWLLQAYTAVTTFMAVHVKRNEKSILLDASLTVAAYVIAATGAIGLLYVMEHSSALATIYSAIATAHALPDYVCFGLIHLASGVQPEGH